MKTLGLAVLDEETQSAVLCWMCNAILARRGPGLNDTYEAHSVMQVRLANAWHLGSDGIYRLPKRIAERVRKNVAEGRMPHFAVRDQQRLYFSWVRECLALARGAPPTPGLSFPSFARLPIDLECYCCHDAICTLDEQALQVVQDARIIYLPPGPLKGGGPELTRAMKNLTEEMNHLTDAVRMSEVDMTRTDVLKAYIAVASIRTL